MHDLTTAVDGLFAELQADLEALVRIPSVSAPSFDPAAVRESAEATAALMRAAGLDDVRMLEHDGAQPAVYGMKRGPADAPTVLLYAHHDVQPAGDLDTWERDPFDPVVEGERLYGRGASDDKAGIIVHLGAIRALGNDLPVTVKVIVEGEEEIGSPNLPVFLAEFGDLLAADVVVIADSANWRVGVPALTTSLRGLVSVIVEVSVLEAAVHSGMFGGAVPDALTVLSRVLAGLHDDDGNVTVPGVPPTEAEPLELSEGELRQQAGVLDGVELIGRGPVTNRLWMAPAISVLAIDAPSVDQAVNALVPSARAKVSMRVPPDCDVDDAMTALIGHIEAQPAWGARVEASALESGPAFLLATDDPRVEAFRTAFAEVWGHQVVEIGVGGSIPFVAAFNDAYPDAAILLTGIGDPTSRAHGPNESMHLGELRREIIAEALALWSLAR